MNIIRKIIVKRWTGSSGGGDDANYIQKTTWYLFGLPIWIALVERSVDFLHLDSGGLEYPSMKDQ